MSYQFPRGVLDPFCAQEHVITTSMDRRLLWHIELVLMHAPIGSQLESLRCELRAYLNQTCDHHWHDYAGDEDIPAHRQCLWCHDVEWTGARGNG